MAYTMIFETFRKEGISDEELRENWLGEHARLAALLPKLRYYEILPVKTAEGAADPAPDGFVLLRFDSEADANAALTSPEMEASSTNAGLFFRHFSTFAVESHVVIG